MDTESLGVDPEEEAASSPFESLLLGAVRLVSLPFLLLAIVLAASIHAASYLIYSVGRVARLAAGRDASVGGGDPGRLAPTSGRRDPA